MAYPDINETREPLPAGVDTTYRDLLGRGITMGSMFSGRLRHKILPKANHGNYYKNIV